LRYVILPVTDRELDAFTAIYRAIY